MSLSQNPLGSLLQELRKQTKDERFSGIFVERYDRWWLKVNLKKENRVLWIGHEADNGFFCTLDRDLPPGNYFKLDSQLNQTADLILSGLLPPLTRKEVEAEVEREIQRLESKIQIQKRTMADGSPAVLIQLRLSDDSPEILTKLVQYSDFQNLPVRANVTLKWGEQQSQTAITTEKKSGAISKLINFISRIPLVYNFLKFIFKPFKSLLNFKPAKHRRTSVDRDIFALQSALKILSNPSFKKAICGSISDDLDLIFKKIVDIGIPTSIIAAGALAISVYGVSITPTGIALVALIISRASIKVYCDQSNSQH